MASRPSKGLHPVKKLVIKPLRLQPKLPDDFESSNWIRLRDAVSAVQSAHPVSCSLEELYTAVENLCVHKLAAKIYPQLQGLCDQHAETMINSLASRSSLDALAFLDHVGRTWERYCSQLLLVRQIFLYLDRTYVLTSSPTRSLFDMGLQLFRAHLGRHPEVERKLVDGLLALIDAERNGEAVDRGLLKELLRMTSNLAMYGDSFQWPFLDRSARYFTAEGERLIHELETSAYLEHCERRLAEEYARCDAYLEPSTKAPLIAAVEGGLVEGHVGQLVGSGFDALLNSDLYSDLKRLYGLCARVGALRALCAAFKTHIQKFGAHIVLDEEKESEMVPSLLKLKRRMDRALHESFSSNPSFANALKEGFEAFINQRANTPAELLAKFMDVALRGGSKGAAAASGTGGGAGSSGASGAGGEEEVEASVDAALVLFRYIQGKDVFEAFYKKDLAKRLLLGRFASIDAEKAAISKLKAECGSQFTSKLEGMFKDVELSKDAMTSFRRSPASSASLSQLCPGIDVNVQVLTSGFWPTYPVLDCALPEKLAAAQHIFSEHYLQKHSGRKLAWINSLGTCIIKAHFNSGDKELSVSLFQATVLLLFNDEEKLSLPEIVAATGLEDRELRRTLQSLACGRERVLHKEPKGREILDGDVFSFNSAYTSRLYRVRINAIQLKETAEEQAKTNESVLQDRQYQVDAAIVRIMKTRKTLAHKLLVNELVAQLRFPVVGADLKKRIESLIDREYLERDPDDAQIYNYLA
jgi:cullin-4